MLPTPVFFFFFFFFSICAAEASTTPVFLPGEFQGQRSLAGYSPWNYKESDMTE